MRRLALIALLLPLAACGEPDRPAPGQAPGWPDTNPPRPSYAPLPFTTNYTVSGQVQDSPPARADGTVPYAVRGQAPAPEQALGQASSQAPARACHPVPPATQADGRVASTVCQQPDGSWAYVAE